MQEISHVNMSLKYFVFLLTIFQSTIIAESLQAQGRYGSPLKEDDLTILSSKSGYLYSGIDNFIKVRSHYVKTSDTILFKSTNGDVLHDSGQVYLLIPERPGKVRLTLYAKSDYDTIIIGYKHFIVKRIPKPQLVVNNTIIQTSDTLMKNTLLTCDSLKVFFSDDIIGSDKWLKIKEFSLGYNYGGFHVSHFNPSNKFTEETKHIIRYLGPDRVISIRLTVESEGMITRQLPIYRITIY
ncbi:hypothetical protein ES705_20726 [subsurface metagenome]